MSREDNPTETFTHRRFIAAVDKVADLPHAGPRDGLLCMVRDECTIYEKVDGAWKPWVSSDVSLD